MFVVASPEVDVDAILINLADDGHVRHTILRPSPWASPVNERRRQAGQRQTKEEPGDQGQEQGKGSRETSNNA